MWITLETSEEDQILKIVDNTMLIQFSVEPNVLIDLRFDELVQSSTLETSVVLTHFDYINRVGKWPAEVLSLVTNIRGGYCCVVRKIKYS
jgi:hypothetical protein